MDRLTITNHKLDYDYQEGSPWRSYHLESGGSTLAELIEEAVISEVDKEAVVLDCYGLSEAKRPIYDLALIILIEAIKLEAFRKTPRKEGST